MSIEERSDSDSDLDPRGGDRVPFDPLPAPSGASSSGAVGPEAALLAPKAAGPKAPLLAPKAAVSPPSSPESFTIGGASSSGVVPGPPAAKTKAAAKATARSKRKQKLLVPAVGAGEVYFMEYTNPLRLEPYGNWTFYCPHHHDCKRTMGVVPSNMRVLKTDLEPLAFLHAWRDCEVDPKKGHRKSPVKEEDVVNFYNEHQDELMAHRDVFYTP